MKNEDRLIELLAEYLKKIDQSAERQEVMMKRMIRNQGKIEKNQEAISQIQKHLLRQNHRLDNLLIELIERYAQLDALDALLNKKNKDPDEPKSNE